MGRWRGWLGVLGVAVALWAAIWFVAARSLERAAETWFAEAAAEGLESGYAYLSVAGFPARLMLTLEAPRLSDPQQAAGWRAEGLRAGAAAWAPRRVDFALEGVQVLTLGTTDIALRGAALEGVARLRAGAAQAVDLDLRALEAVGPDPDLVLSLAEGQARVRRTDAQMTLAVGLAGLDAAGLDWPGDLAPRPDGPVTRVDLRATAAFGPAPADPRAPHPVEWLALDALTLEWGDVRLRGAGRMELTPDGHPEGRITLEAEGWAPLVALAAALGLLDPEIARTWLRVLDALAQDGPAPGVVSVPVVARDGWLSVGPLPLGRAPRLAAPRPAAP
ncbi:hypothetical protein CCR87_13735 [Rhodobaculum claviforme]|uniref:DUF2125 domain-containing protein n=1 Tax=Rhodobaculum claviforme TaxID=1549854 RepID=A0A934WIM3_9RHOB|nr:hypothetical protein [Rhodobaculum claviforme]